MVIGKNTKTKSGAKTARKVSKSSGTKTGTKRVASQKKVTSDEFFQMLQKRSYELFVNQGYGHGNDQGHWYAAEKELSKKFKIM